MLNILRRFKNNTSGATAIEYGLIVAGIAVTIIFSVQNLGTTLNTTFIEIEDEINS